jgi:hypothetical protein
VRGSDVFYPGAPWVSRRNQRHPSLSIEQFDDALATLEGSRDCGKVMVTLSGDR